MEVFGKQGDIAEGVVVAFACCADNCDALFVGSYQKFDRLGLVVGILVSLIADYLGKACAILSRELVAITDNDVGCAPFCDKGICATVATDHKWALCHDL